MPPSKEDVGHHNHHDLHQLTPQILPALRPVQSPNSLSHATVLLQRPWRPRPGRLHVRSAREARMPRKSQSFRIKISVSAACTESFARSSYAKGHRARIPECLEASSC